MRVASIVALVLLVLSSSCSDRGPIETEQQSTDDSSAKPQQETELTRESSAPGSTDSPKISTPPPQLLSPEQIEDGWISLFDGATLFGWKANSSANWTVDDGVITADSGEPGLLLTTFRLSDYELRFDCRLEPGGNSGVFLRTVESPSDPAVDCYEFNLCDTHDSFPTGSLVGRKTAETALDTEGKWKMFHLRLAGPKIEATYEGRQILEFDDNSPAARSTGLIGLQMNGGRVEFRNVHLRPLGLEPLFNGDDLNGWHVVDGSKSRFDVADGEIRVSDGPGFLETDGVFADFVLQASVKTHGRHLNSGIFFRAMPGTLEAPSNGYEVQIHNGYEEGDRSQPLDFGTGAIFRRAKARWVVADDNRWCTITLAATGPHFSVWVDGIQVTDWTDPRDRHENPRRGQRLEAGHISLQGHDPTTDLAFRDLRIAPVPNE